MDNTNQEKYLGDLVNNSGTIRDTIEERRSKGFGIVAEITAILEEVPLGRYKLEIGLKLRQAMLLNAILFNSEAMHSVSEVEIKRLEAVDEHLLRTLVKSHAKTPLEFLYMEAGATPIRFIISSRRLIYHQVILKRDDKELTNKIYNAQKDDCTPGDFVDLLAKDFILIEEHQDDNKIGESNCNSYKKNIKAKIKTAAFKYLKEAQQTHSKVKQIQYKKLEIQKYMTSPLFSNEEVNLLHALRSRSTECKENFKQKYTNSNLLCNLCKVENEDQAHLMRCRVIQDNFDTEEIANRKIKYDDIFSENIVKQKEITSLFIILFKIRNEIQENQTSQPAPSNLT